MGLYLCIFDNGDELDGVEVGGYSDFFDFRQAIVQRLENGNAGTKYPTLILHSDCDGKWSHNQCAKLEKELEEIVAAFQNMPPVAFGSGWQQSVAKNRALQPPRNLYESFIDVNGEPLLERLLTLCRLAQNHNLPILFQ